MLDGFDLVGGSVSMKFVVALARVTATLRSPVLIVFLAVVSREVVDDRKSIASSKLKMKKLQLTTRL